MNFKNKKTKDNLIIGLTNSGRQRKLISEMPYTYLKAEIENKNIPERFINSVFKQNFPIMDTLIILHFIEKDGYDVSSFEIFDSVYTVKDDPNTEMYIVFKDIKKGTEFLVLYHDDVKKCQFGYCTKKGEVFSPKITIKECIEHYDPKHCFISY
mgnify:FL=1